MENRIEHEMELLVKGLNVDSILGISFNNICVHAHDFADAAFGRKHYRISIWWFPKIRNTFFWGPYMKIIQFWGQYLGPAI